MKISALCLLLCAAATAVNAQATTTADTDASPDSDYWRVMASPYTYHYSNDPDHREVYMIGLETQRADGWVWGGSYFRNSFGQPSAYGYVGKRYTNFTSYEPLFAQLTGGILYGYKEPYNRKVPLNYKGWSPGAVLSVGWQFTPMWSGQLNFLGNSALMFQLSADLK